MNSRDPASRLATLPFVHLPTLDTAPLREEPAHSFRATMGFAIVASARAFGAAHVPASAPIAPLDGVLVARAVGLNTVAGVLFGWIYWRHLLEAAMLAHVFAHVARAFVPFLGSG